jgi:hypothetical protein
VLTGETLPRPGLAIERAGAAVGTVLYGTTIGSRRHEALAVLIDEVTSATANSAEGHSVEDINDPFY